MEHPSKKATEFLRIWDESVRLVSQARNRDDGKFRTFETMTGKKLWSFNLESSANNVPVSHLGKDARQCVAVIAAGGGNGGVPSRSDAIQVFALPK